jgi:hypothetical protein
MILEFHLRPSAFICVHLRSSAVKNLNLTALGGTPTLPERKATSSMETDFPELQALPGPGFGDRGWVLRGRLPSGDLPQTSRNPSTLPPLPAESAMSIHPQIIEKDECKGLIVLPDGEFAASRPRLSRSSFQRSRPPVAFLTFVASAE